MELVKFYAVSLFFLSLIAYGGAYELGIDTLNHPYTLGMAYNNPFSGATGFDIELALDDWMAPKEPVPYHEFWENPFGQTAQQMVAICSMLEEEAGISCYYTRNNE